MENACVAKASQLLAPFAWMLTSAEALQESVDLTPCAKTPWGPTPAPAHLPLLDLLPLFPAQNPARASLIIGFHVLTNLHSESIATHNKYTLFCVHLSI